MIIFKFMITFTSNLKLMKDIRLRNMIKTQDTINITSTIYTKIVPNVQHWVMVICTSNNLYFWYLIQFTWNTISCRSKDMPFIDTYHIRNDSNLNPNFYPNFHYLFMENSDNVFVKNRHVHFIQMYAHVLLHVMYL